MWYEIKCRVPRGRNAEFDAGVNLVKPQNPPGDTACLELAAQKCARTPDEVKRRGSPFASREILSARLLLGIARCRKKTMCIVVGSIAP